MNRLAANPRLTLALVLAMLVAWRLLAAADARLNLSIDEAQYFLWSLEPAWGYFSKPPMIAWVIAGATSVCGDSEACIRLPATLLFAAGVWLIAVAISRLYDARTGMWAGIAFATLFLTSFYSWVMTTDSILLFLWSLSLLLFLKVLDSDRWRDWLALGLCIGLGLLTKYTMSLFLGCALLVLWIDHRPRLASPRPWLAALLALACLLPNLVWNLDHQFATLRHTAEISQLDRELFHPASLAYFVAAQFGIMGPLLLPALLAAAADRQAWRNDARHRLLAFFSLPVLGLFVALSLLSRSHANWAAPSYVAATALAIVWLLQRRHIRWLAWAIAINLLFAAALYHWHQLAPAAGIELRKGTDPFSPLRGWDAAGRQLAEQLRVTGCRAVITADRGTLVELAYYSRRALGAPVAALAYNPRGEIHNHFELSADIAQRRYDCAVLVGHFKAEVLAQEFSELQALPSLAVPQDGHLESLPSWRVGSFKRYAHKVGRR